MLLLLLLPTVLPQAWSNSCCPSGYTCTRSSEWFYQCTPNGSGGGNNNNGGGNNNGGNNGGNNNNGGDNNNNQPNDPSKYKPAPPVAAKKINGEASVARALCVI